MSRSLPKIPELSPAQEKEFHAAYSSIERVASISADSITEIKANGSPLPSVYIDLMQEYEDMGELRGLFCPFKIVEAKQKLKEYCFKNRVQPRDFKYEGLLAVDKRVIPVVEYTYIGRSA